MVVPGVPYHITQRGNRREDVFFCDGDRKLPCDGDHPEASRPPAQAGESAKTEEGDMRIGEAPLVSPKDSK